jgi:hypothetical protein
MDLRFRIYVSTPLASSLTPQQQQLMDAFLRKLNASGFRPRGYYAAGLDGISEIGGKRALVECCKGIHDTAIWYP